MATVSSIVRDALIEIGVMDPEETLSAKNGALGLLRFQNQLDSWRAQRLTLATQARTTFTLTSGTSTVTLGPAAATVTMARPVWVDALNYVIPGSSPTVEVPLAPLTEQAYQELSIKSLSSALPTQYFYETSLTQTYGNLFIWPQVNQNVSMVLYSPEAVGVPTALASSVIGPPGYQEAFLYQLALRLCTPFGVPVPPLLPEMAQRAWKTMTSVNVMPGVLGVDLALTPGAGAGYNVYSDTGA